MKKKKKSIEPPQKHFNLNGLVFWKHSWTHKFMILKNRIYELKNKNNKDNLSITAKLLNNEKRKRANRQRATQTQNSDNQLNVRKRSEVCWWCAHSKLITVTTGNPDSTDTRRCLLNKRIVGFTAEPPEASISWKTRVGRLVYTETFIIPSKKVIIN